VSTDKRDERRRREKDEDRKNYFFLDKRHCVPDFKLIKPSGSITTSYYMLRHTASPKVNMLWHTA
jgi:hypothetical protein